MHAAYLQGYDALEEPSAATLAASAASAASGVTREMTSQREVPDAAGGTKPSAVMPENEHQAEKDEGQSRQQYQAAAPPRSQTFVALFSQGNIGKGSRIDPPAGRERFEEEEEQDSVAVS